MGNIVELIERKEKVWTRYNRFRLYMKDYNIQEKELANILEKPLSYIESLKHGKEFSNSDVRKICLALNISSEYFTC